MTDDQLTSASKDLLIAEIHRLQGERNDLARRAAPEAAVLVPLREVIWALEGAAGNTDTDPRWLAAALLRELPEQSRLRFAAPTDSQAGRDAVEALSRDPDGDISMDWQTPSGDMLSMSLSANGDFCVAVSTQRGKGTCRVLIPDLAFEVLDACLVAAGRAE